MNSLLLEILVDYIIRHNNFYINNIFNYLFMKKNNTNTELMLVVEYEDESKEIAIFQDIVSLSVVKREFDICNQLSTEEKIKLRNATHQKLVASLIVFDFFGPSEFEKKICHLLVQYFCLSEAVIDVFNNYSTTGAGIKWFISSNGYGLNELKIMDSESFKHTYEDMFD